MDKKINCVLNRIEKYLEKMEQRDYLSEMLPSHEVMKILSITDDTLCKYDEKGITKPIWLDSSSRRKYYLRADLNDLIRSRI